MVVEATVVVENNSSTRQGKREHVVVGEEPDWELPNPTTQSTSVKVRHCRRCSRGLCEHMARTWGKLDIFSPGQSVYGAGAPVDVGVGGVVPDHLHRLFVAHERERVGEVPGGMMCG